MKTLIRRCPSRSCLALTQRAPLFGGGRKCDDLVTAIIVVGHHCAPLTGKSTTLSSRVMCAPPENLTRKRCEPGNDPLEFMYTLAGLASDRMVGLEFNTQVAAAFGIGRHLRP